MAPKHDLRDVSQGDDSDIGKRPRKSAWTTTADRNPTAATTSRPLHLIRDKDLDDEVAAHSNTSTAMDDACAEPVASPRGDPPPGKDQVKGKATECANADVRSTSAEHAPLPGDIGDNVEHAPLQHATLDNIRTLFSFIDYVPDDDVRRFMPFVRKSDEANHHYALSCIPPATTWGTSPETDGFLCVDNKPITIWVVGNTESPWFVTPDGEPHSQVNIGFQLPFDGDLVIVKKLYEKAKPKRTDLDDIVFSVKRMTTYGSKSGKTILPFKNVYDVTERFQAKSNMSLLPPGMIGKCDIVLVKLFFTRWRTERDKLNRRKWLKWNVTLELQAVNLLYEALPDLEEQYIKPPEPVPDFDDDM